MTMSACFCVFDFYLALAGLFAAVAAADRHTQRFFVLVDTVLLADFHFLLLFADRVA